MVYVYPSKQLYIYFERAQKAPREWLLTGWRITPVESQGLQPLRISQDAYTFVANSHYQQGLKYLAAGQKDAATVEFDKALPLILTLQQLNPSNEFALQSAASIYDRLGRSEKAKQAYEKMIADNPTKERYVSYGYVLMQMKDYTSAISAFEKALLIDPNYKQALFNIAAGYKNIASSEQQANDPKLNADIIAKMQKSTEYFERYHTIDHSDYVVLSNLAENYLILKRKDKAIALLAELEAMNNSEAAKDPLYWETLGKLYARADRTKDSEVAFKRADELKNH
jgi:tetratricopeptide (TPR) repeat protein